MKNITELKEQFQKGKKIKYLFFWGHTQKNKNIIDKSCFSQWYPRGFTIDEVYYATAEHYMMAEKARMFDKSMVEKILNAKTSKEVKALGRKVKNFDNEVWDKESFDVVVRGNVAKFSQHEDLKEYLLSTSSKVIVEASPYDKIWGIGMLADDEHASNHLKWRGLNKLGFALMVVREELEKKC